MMNRTRMLTVSRLYREWGEPHRKRECAVPSIRLNGKWLSQLGLVLGQKIRIIANGAILTLAPASFEAELRHSQRDADVNPHHFAARFAGALSKSKFLLDGRLASKPL